MLAACWIARRMLTLLIFILFGLTARGQSISGFSTVGEIRTFSSKKGVITPIFIQAYSDTQEDYTASLYYNVAAQSALFYEGNQTPVVSQFYQGNPSASGSYNLPSGVTSQAGMYTVVTNHYVDFFYVASAGQYFDPYGFSVVSSDGGDDGYGSGYWFYLYAALYVVEAQALVGQSFGSVNHNPSLLTNPGITSVMYQAFIPPDYVGGPPGATCLRNIYSGDNRGLNPAGGSYRALQQVVVGYAGLTVNSPPVQATGYTYRFSTSVVQNGQIPASAYNYAYLGQCSSSGIDAYGHASTSNMVPPVVTYAGASTSVQLSGSASDPVPLWSFSIDWNYTVNLVQTGTFNLHASGTYSNDCYPAHELSVQSVDVYNYVPAANDLATVSLCLAGVGSLNGQISKDIPII